MAQRVPKVPKKIGSVGRMTPKKSVKPVSPGRVDASRLRVNGGPSAAEHVERVARSSVVHPSINLPKASSTQLLSSLSEKIAAVAQETATSRLGLTAKYLKSPEYKSAQEATLKVEELALDANRFPRFVELDKQFYQQAVDKAANIAFQAQKEGSQFYGSMRMEPFEDTDIPYYRLIAQGLDYLFIGESHSPANNFTHPVQEEIIRMIQTVVQQNPSRKIVVAFEHLFDTNDPSARLDSDIPLALARNDAEYAQVTAGNTFNLAVADAVHEMGVEVLGLDPRIELSKIVQEETGASSVNMFTSNDYVDFSRSYVGFSLRHAKWTEHIRQLRAQPGYENSLVVVVAGAAHVSKNGILALSSALGGKSATYFVVSHGETGNINPVFTQVGEYFKRPPQQAPKAMTDQKWVISFKPTEEARTADQLQKYTEFLGCDGAILVPDVK